jgi:phosphate:Na+ symporter
MVKRSVLRSFGAQLRRTLSIGTKNRFTSFISGAFVTFFLQSSTATILLISSFAKNGLITSFAALAIVIGADVSTTLVARVLVLDLSLLAPILIIAGFAAYSDSAEGLRNQYARILIGIGIMLLSLTLLRQSVAPLSESAIFPTLIAPLKGDPLIAILIAAAVTWLMHSSLAAVLLFATLATSAHIDVKLGLYLIMGANLGGAIIPYVLLLKDKNTAVRQITVGNLIMRGSMIILLLPLADIIVAMTEIVSTHPAIALVNMHIAFNVLLALIFIPLVGMLSSLCIRIVPDKLNKEAPGHPVFLDDKALDTPVIALAGAARETLRMAEYVENMLEQTIRTFQKNDLKLVQKIRETENIVDEIYQNIKLYMTRVSRESLDRQESNRYMQILTFSTNLEYSGDVIVKNLMDSADKKIRKGENFSKEGMEEIEEFHKAVLENMQLAQNIFMLQDAELAGQLVEGKKYMRKAMRKSSERHFQRLSEGRTSSLATSALHMDVIRDYRRINTYMTAVAYNILEQEKKAEKAEKEKKKAEKLEKAERLEKSDKSEKNGKDKKSKTSKP